MDILGILAIFVLVAINGFFVAGEFSLVKIRKTRIEQLAAEGKSTARLVQRQLEHLDNFIAATQLGITLASLALGWVGEPALAHLIEPPIKAIAGESAETIANTIGVIISFALITTFHIVLGELVPKSVALQRTEGVVLFVARPLDLFARIFRPFIRLMNGVGNAVVRLVGLSAASEHEVYSVEELEMLVSESREAGILDSQEEVLLRRVFDFSDKDAAQIMRPRTVITGIPVTASLESLVSLALSRHYTRYPVYRDNLDNILGVLHTKDLLLRLRQDQREQPFSLEQFIRPVLRVPETVSVEDVLSAMKTQQSHMAVVIDEYGGTAGIVTLEDILEEIIGEVRDEFEKSGDTRPEVEVLGDSTTSISGLLSVPAFEEQFGIELGDTDFETIAGYVFGQLGRTPLVGDEIEAGHYRLRIEEMNGLRIARLRVFEGKATSSPLKEQ